MPESGTTTHAADATTLAPRRPRVAVVVGSGGLKCAAAIGMWKALIRAGLGIDLAVGCSGGSIYTAAMALGMPVADLERATLHGWDGLFKKLRMRSLFRSLLPFSLGFNERMGLVNDRAVDAALRGLFGDASFADTRIPLHLAATEVHSGERYDICTGSIVDAVRASIAIPLLLRPREIDGHLLMDGGASDPLPISIAIREGADIILAMGFESPPAESLDSLSKVAGQAISTTVNHLLRSTYAFYSAVHHAEIIPLMPEFKQAVRLADTHLIPHIIEQGERVTEAELPYLKRLLASRAGKEAAA